MKYWKVICYVGHCGRGNRRELALGIEAETCTQAMLVAKKFPGVKHGSSQYICSTREITREEYLIIRQQDNYAKALRRKS